MSNRKAIAEARELLTVARKIAKSFRDEATTPTKRLNLCRQLLSRTAIGAPLEDFRGRLVELTIDERHYWIGTFYTLLLEIGERQSLAAYFTPPHLTTNIVTLAQEAGFKPGTHTVIDPAAGGAAFLSTIAASMRRSKLPAEIILERLRGMEIESGLARLSETLVGERLGGVEVDPASIVRHCDSLRVREIGQFDLVVANPPYGRIALADTVGSHWKNVTHSGHINRYALFAELCLRLAKPGGLMALVVPASVMGGPLYDRLRSHIRSKAEIKLLASVIDRDDVFVDVAQDVAVLLARVGKAHQATSYVSFGRFAGRNAYKSAGASRLPAEAGGSWLVPLARSRFPKGGATLSDYGATVRAGYFVWNREKERMKRKGAKPLTVPLIWAKNIRAGKLCVPTDRKGKGTDFVRFKEDSPSIIRSDALVLQRTTTSSQPRRLVAARIDPATVKKHGGVVSENHTIVITTAKAVMLKRVLTLLNSKPVDDRYRQLSGTASIAVTLLRTLDLPKPDVLARAFDRFGYTDQAIEEAYLQSADAVAEKRA